MKKLFYIFAMSISLSCLMACSDKNEPEGPPEYPEVPKAVLEEFKNRYPGATDVSWSTKEKYAIANFCYADAVKGRDGNVRKNNTAWFSLLSQEWCMTDTELAYPFIPEAVRTAFEASDYGRPGSEWEHDKDVDFLQRGDGTEKLYVISVQKKKESIIMEVDLYYTETGLQVKEIMDAQEDNDYSEFLYQKTEGNIGTWLKDNFPDARIIDIDQEHSGTEVEIVSNGLKHEILFDLSQQWIYTKTEYDRMLSGIPKEIMESLKESSHYTSDRAIDDADRYDTKEYGIYYCFELRKAFGDDVNVYVDETGIITRPNLVESNIPVEKDIETFIQQKYAGALIIEKDYDDGYLEIGIYHDNKEKELKFNGRNEWITTKWECSFIELPEAVQTVLLADKEFNRNYIEEIEAEETRTAVVYKVEIDLKDKEIKYFVSASGTILYKEYDD